MNKAITHRHPDLPSLDRACFSYFSKTKVVAVAVD